MHWLLNCKKYSHKFQKIEIHWANKSMPGTSTDARQLIAVLRGPACTKRDRQPSVWIIQAPAKCADETLIHLCTIAAYIAVVDFMHALQQERQMSAQTR